MSYKEPPRDPIREVLFANDVQRLEDKRAKRQQKPRYESYVHSIIRERHPDWTEQEIDDLASEL